MSENFVRKTLNVEKIGEKETYTLHDLDLVETKNGHVFIRIFKQNAKPDSTDQNAYLYELTNSVRSINKMALVESEQLNNSSILPLPLVMELQYLPDSVKLTMVGDTTDQYKVNGVAGVFNNEKTTYEIPLSGDTLPDITIKRGQKVIDVYKLHQADLHQTNPLHPEFVKGAKECCDRLTAVEKRLDNIIVPELTVDINNLTLNAFITVDDPTDNPTRPACLDDIEIFYGESGNLTKPDLQWEHTRIISVESTTPNVYDHVFYQWEIQIMLPKPCYVLIKRNGVIVHNSFADNNQGGGDIS